MSITLFAALLLMQQPIDTTKAAVWHVSPAFQELTEAFIAVDAAPIQGFRVQLFNGSRREAEKRRAEILRMFDDVSVYLSYDAPEYLVQAGNFIDRIHAEAFAQKLKRHVSSAFVIQSPIEAPSWEELQSAQHIDTNSIDIKQPR